MAFCIPDGNGGSNIPNIKPKTLRISIGAVVIFVMTLIFYAGGKSGDVKHNTEAINKIDTKLDKELAEIKPVLNALNAKMDLLLMNAKITINQ